ncbi:MAG: GNAT family N-acetyltransferase [Pyrinomonadaceae bacterium]|nr:GNAT family N-acetyltransferase [Pyrinomonadaceae bacterium]
MFEIETARLRLRPFAPDDLDALVALRSRAEVVQYIGGATQTREFIEQRLRFYISCYEQYGFGMSGVVQKPDRKLIGWCGLQPLEDSGEIEVGYGFDKPYWRQGFAFEAAAAWLKYGFEHAGLKRIVAVTMPENEGSWRVMEKLGMHFEKRARHYNLECLFYAIAREEFQPNNSFYALHN